MFALAMRRRDPVQRHGRHRHYHRRRRRHHRCRPAASGRRSGAAPTRAHGCVCMGCLGLGSLPEAADLPAFRAVFCWGLHWASVRGGMGDRERFKEHSTRLHAAP